MTEREEIQAAEASPEALAAGKDILEQLVQLMGFNAAVTIHSGTTSKIDITGADDEEREALGALIGRKGERLSALQHLVNLLLSKKLGEWTRILVDVEDYRGRRERQLRDLANRAAERVMQTGKMLQLEPMPALERRWIHLALRDHDRVATQSIGEEPNRRQATASTSATGWAPQRRGSAFPRAQGPTPAYRRRAQDAGLHRVQRRHLDCHGGNSPQDAGRAFGHPRGRAAQARGLWRGFLGPPVR